MKTAIIVGASRGLGLGLVREYLARGWRVIATTRGRNDAGLHDLVGRALQIETLDVADGSGIAAFAKALPARPIDLLFVCAGINDRTEKGDDIDPVSFTHVMLTNALAPLTLIEALGPRVAPDGAIVAMTSVLGSVDANTSGGSETYRASKAALNSLLRSYAARNRQRSIVAMHPGWVRTDMGGAHADVGIADSARGMADVIETRAGEAGCVFVDYRGQTIAW